MTTARNGHDNNKFELCGKTRKPNKSLDVRAKQRLSYIIKNAHFWDSLNFSKRFIL